MLLYKRYHSGQEKLLNAGAMKQDSNLVKNHSHDSMAGKKVTKHSKKRKRQRTTKKRQNCNNRKNDREHKKYPQKTLAMDNNNEMETTHRNRHEREKLGRTIQKHKLKKPRNKNHK